MNLYEKFGSKMLLVCTGCYCLGVLNYYKEEVNLGKNWLVCKHDWKMEMFIISNRYKIKLRRTLSNKGQLRELCDKNQIKTRAIRPSVKASDSVKVAHSWKGWLSQE